MTAEKLLTCDGCGQLADSAHISRRLERLAWATRFRPLHIQALLLGGIAPKLESDFLYAPRGSFTGESDMILSAVQLSTEGKPAEAVLTEFQKLGLMLTHVLDCPLSDGVSESQAQVLIEKQLPATIARIRRSLKPKRVLLFSGELQPHASRFHETQLSCPVLPAVGGCFLASTPLTESDLLAFRSALALSSAQTVQS
jgi:hypothetical protein